MRDENFKNMKEKYDFFLNPYTDCAFSKCPKCESKTKQKKLPLVIHLNKKKIIFILNKTCRFCPYCELLIAKKYEIKEFLSAKFGREFSEEDYFIMGTLEKSSCVEGIRLMGEHFFDNVYIFKDEWNFEPNKPRWMRLDK